MKNLILILLIIISASTQAQTIKGDTLFVTAKVKYINIGGRVYEVLPPTLKEAVQPAWDSLIPTYPHLGYNSFIPSLFDPYPLSGSITVDTTAGAHRFMSRFMNGNDTLSLHSLKFE
jgi:hypothetical protein